MSNHTKPTIAAVGTAFLLGLGATSAVAADNPFAAQPLSSGYAELAEAKCGAEATPKADTEGKCGEAKCGGNQ
ncbi:MAG: hypothetical protein GYB41_12335 [Oceanospirillales bacterium]|nr:hypothetical protein [Oceanospirillales bacterium]